jgi:hypothetical protein
MYPMLFIGFELCQTTQNTETSWHGTSSVTQKRLPSNRQVLDSKYWPASDTIPKPRTFQKPCAGGRILAPPELC